MKTVPSYKVSIIMPTYNRANYIGETIESVRNQTYKNWELIIVDDGSEDNTGVIISRVKDERIRFYIAGRIAINGKIKNIGIEKANGEHEFACVQGQKTLMGRGDIVKDTTLSIFNKANEAGNKEIYNPTPVCCIFYLRLR